MPKSQTTSVRQSYDQIGQAFSATRPHLSKKITALIPQLKPSAPVLDLGCGNGVLLTALPTSINYLGIDFSKVLLEQAKRLYPQNNFRLADITNAPTWQPLGQFDFIAALAVFHHLPEPQDHLTLLTRIGNHLAPGGQVLISVWNLNPKKFDRYRTGRHLAIPFHGGAKRDFYAFNPTELPNLAKNANLSVIIQETKGNNFYYVLGKNLD